MSKFVNFCKIVDSGKAQVFIFGVIILNALLLGLETITSINDTVIADILAVANNVFIVIYIVEILMRLVVHRLSFFKSGWNIFDFLIIVVTTVSSVGVFAVLRLFRLFRMFRILRLMRLVSGLQKLRVLVESILKSLPSIAWLFALLLLILYMFSVMSTMLFSELCPELFGSLASSAFTLFTMMTLEGWPDVAREVMEYYPYANFVFVPYILITAFIVLNVFVGIIVDSMSSVAEKQAKEAEEGSDAEKLRNEISRLKESVESLEDMLEDMLDDGVINNSVRKKD